MNDTRDGLECMFAPFRNSPRRCCSPCPRPVRALLVVFPLFLLLAFSRPLPTLGARLRVVPDRDADEPFTFGQPTNLGSQEKNAPKAGVVLSLCYSPDGQTLATAGADQANRRDCWDTTSWKVLTTFTGHTDAVTSVAFSPDGKLLATASYDQTVRLWDRVAGKELRTLRGHTNAVSCVAFAPDGLTLASGSFDKTVRLWETASGKELAQLKGHRAGIRALAFSPRDELLASGSGDRSVLLWNLTDRSEKARLNGCISAAAVRGLAFAPDGRHTGQRRRGQDGPALEDRPWEVRGEQAIGRAFRHGPGPDLVPRRDPDHGRPGWLDASVGSPGPRDQGRATRARRGCHLRGLRSIRPADRQRWTG